MDRTNQPNENAVDERELLMSMRKLDLIKELGDKQNQFQRIRETLQQNVEIISRESQVLRDFRKELDLLVQERMSHIEELRLIHADINIMETTIKQAEEERIRNIQESKHLLKDYQPVKEQVNRLREVLNLEKFENDDEEESALQLINQQSNEPEIIPHRNFPAALGILEATSDAISLTTNSNSSTPLHKIPTSLDRSNFRQQPPPMKTCQSCQQQIHRNAPICPICKAKSRSRNPKKPKRRSFEASQK